MSPPETVTFPVNVAFLSDASVKTSTWLLSDVNPVVLAGAVLNTIEPPVPSPVLLPPCNIKLLPSVSAVPAVVEPPVIVSVLSVYPQQYQHP